MKSGNTLSKFLVAFVLVIYSELSARADLFFGPREAAGIQNGNLYFKPFDQAGRLQQLYSSDGFSDLALSGGGTISSIFFRVDATDGRSFHSTIPSFQLNISTTARSVDGLSAVFEENVGANDMIAIGPTSISIAGLGGGGSTSFDIGFDLREHPFFYNPADGNLLLDFRINEGLPGIPNVFGVAILDAFEIEGDSVSSVFASGSSQLPSGQVSTLGLATRFTITPIPEPSSLILLGLTSLLGICVGLNRTRKS